ncbi:hypothetical protein VaNZ11_014342, partial [Volvox africanus]
MPLARQTEPMTTKRPRHVCLFSLRNHYPRYSTSSLSNRQNHRRPSFAANAGVASTREHRPDRTHAYAASFLLLLPAALGLIRVAPGVVAALQFGCMSGVHTLLEAISSADVSEPSDLSDADNINGNLSEESATDSELRNDLADYIEALNTNGSVDPEELLWALLTILATGSLGPRQVSQLGPLYVWLTATWLTASLCKLLLAFAMALDPIKSWLFLLERNVHFGLGAAIVRGLVLLLPAFVLPLRLPWMRSILLIIRRDGWQRQPQQDAQQDEQHRPSQLVPQTSTIAGGYAVDMRASDVGDGGIADAAGDCSSMLGMPTESSGCSSLTQLSTAAEWRDLSGLVNAAASDTVKWRARVKRDSSQLALNVLRVAVLLGTSVASVLVLSTRSVPVLVRTVDLLAAAASAAVALAAFLEVWKNDDGYLLVNNAERAVKLALLLLVIRGSVEIAAALSYGNWSLAWFSCSVCYNSWICCGFTDTNPDKAYYHLCH